ncbi:hypothetical protein [Vulcanisaeta sp. JCM 14467]|nr:hypothetical protein [Vulcanisaeta sp. JCM 14467]
MPYSNNAQRGTASGSARRAFPYRTPGPGQYPPVGATATWDSILNTTSAS